jgi:hypothetical protein
MRAKAFDTCHPSARGRDAHRTTRTLTAVARKARTLNESTTTPAGPTPVIDHCPSGARHWWMIDNGDAGQARPGLLIGWRRTKGSRDWEGRVVLAVLEDDAVTLIQTWLPASTLRSIA